MSRSLKIGVSNETMLGRAAISKADTAPEHGRQIGQIAASLGTTGMPQSVANRVQSRAGGNDEGRSWLLVARNRGQSRHVLQQNSTALQVENAVFPPLL